MLKKYLKDENGNSIKCGFKGCNKLATTYFIPPLKDNPLCDEHDKYLNSHDCMYKTDKHGYNGYEMELL